MNSDARARAHRPAPGVSGCRWQPGASGLRASGCRWDRVLDGWCAGARCWRVVGEGAGAGAARSGVARCRRAGVGRLVFVAGEAGVGKTALVRRFCEQARGSRVVWSGCDPLATPAPLGSVVEVAQQLAGSAAAVMVAGARPSEVARALLEDLRRARNAVVVLEDLHWADGGTVDVLGCVVRRVERVPVLVVCTYGDDELEAAHPLRVMLGRVATARSVERLRLERLSETAVGRCIGVGMLEAHGRAVRFRHELARMVLEQERDPARRVALDRRVLRALEGAGGSPERLVHHAERAGDNAALLRWAAVAGERSAALGAHREAAQHYARAVAVSLASSEGTRAELLRRCAVEHYLIDQLDRAIVLQRESVALLRATGDRVREGDGLRWLSRFLWFGGRGEEAEAVAGEAVVVLEQTAPGPELARAYSNLAQLRMLSYDTGSAITWSERALELAERFGVAEVAVHALSNIGTAEVIAGREREGRAKIQASLARARAAGLDDDVGRAYANLVTAAVERRQSALADRFLAEGIAYCAEHDLASYGLYLRAWRARQALNSGRWHAAGEEVSEVLAHPEASPPTQIVAHVVAGLLAARTGDHARARGLLEQANAFAARTGELQRLAPVAAARAEAAWLRRELEEVDDATAAAVTLAAKLDQPWARGTVAVAAACRSQIARRGYGIAVRGRTRGRLAPRRSTVDRPRLPVRGGARTGRVRHRARATSSAHRVTAAGRPSGGSDHRQTPARARHPSCAARATRGDEGQLWRVDVTRA